MINLAVEPSVVWRWLAGVFAGPLDASALAASRTGIEQIAADAPSPGVAAGLRRMRQTLDALPPGPPGVAMLAHAYTRLFSGAGGAAAVPPYESAFTTPNGRLFGPAEARMRALLADLDLRVADGLAEPADHIAIELATMAVLADADAPATCRAELADGLNGWLHAFAEACAAHDRSGFYAGAAAAAAALADHEIRTGRAGANAMSQGDEQ